MKSHISHSRLKFFSQFITFLNKCKNAFFALACFLIAKNRIAKTRTLKVTRSATLQIFDAAHEKTYFLAAREKRFSHAKTHDFRPLFLKKIKNGQ
jgi:hypothetical protein